MYKAADGNLERAERGIVVLDEFDKIITDKDRGLEMKRAVQQDLLDFMGGGSYEITTSKGFLGLGGESVKFDTSKLTFICLGALTNLREEKQSRKQPVGFNPEYKENIEVYSITPQDLVNIGFERELVGRFNTYLHTKDYSKQDLKKILKESEISPLIGFEELAQLNNKNIEFENGVIDLIVDAAYDLNTGARSLQTVINTIRSHCLKNILRGKESTILLTKADVEKFLEYTTNRKVRG